MATPIRFAPVLTGDEAIEFYERWYATMDKPDSHYPSKEELVEMEKFFRDFEEREYAEKHRK